MTDAVIVSTARTGLAKSWRGGFNLTHGATLGGHVTKAAVERAKLDPARVEDVVMGCANPEGATGGNIARQIALRAGLPVSVPGMTVNRFCSSGLQTIALAAQRVIAGEGDVFVAGGVESISCVQNEMNRHLAFEGWLQQNKPEIYWSMLQTAENVAKRYEISKARQDEYGVQSQQRAAAGQRGSFGKAIARGAWAFVRTYWLRGGFLDGRAGFMIAVFNAETVYYRFLKLALLNKHDGNARGPR